MTVRISMTIVSSNNEREAIMSLGSKIREARKKGGLTLEQLADACGKKKTWLSCVEKDAFKGGPSDEDLLLIAERLNDRSILIYALMESPICQRIIPRAFTPLNNIKTDLSAIISKVQEELDEATEASKILARIFSHKDPETAPHFKATLLAKLEQLMDVPRAVEEAFDSVKKGGFLTEEEHLEIRIRQQAKCEAHGHHKPELERREGVRRNGTER
ncbi:MAG: helix-turn-helix domain-containing protein [Geopsychrobacter sp.]|nr:helix-turn-helix domain-containing protein [Geopsychrobacter sp.]